MSKNIEILEKASGLSLSDEQKAILNRETGRPTLVLSSAGSGKSSTEMFDIVYKILNNQLKPNEVMALTFSKNAQLDMKKKYEERVKEVNEKTEGSVATNVSPYIGTFDALYRKLYFYLLKVNGKKIPKIMDNSIVFNVRKKVSRIVINKEAGKSNWDVMDDYSQLKDCLINNGFSKDGIAITFENVTSHNKTEFIEIAMRLQNSVHSPFGHNEKAEYWSNYYDVTKLFNDVKQQKNVVDFNDIKINLLEMLDNENDLKVSKNFLNNYKQVYLDEFQDINKLQWDLLTKVLSEKALLNITAIGDDDQSIYGWRGSNPKYILNFDDFVYNPQVLHLSTNYRTAGKILKTVIPEIENNHYRLDKTIKAASEKENYGLAFLYNDVENVPTEGNAYLKQLLNMANDKKIKNKDIAVLVRKNVSKTFLFDWLYSHDVKQNIEQENLILQNTKAYQFSLEFIKMFLNDDLQTFRNKGKVFCYGNFFEEHFQKVMEFAKNNGYKFETISDYSEIATEYDDINPIRYSKSKKNGRKSYAFKIIRDLDKKVYNFYSDFNLNDVLKAFDENLFDDKSHAWELRNDFEIKEQKWNDGFKIFVEEQAKEQNHEFTDDEDWVEGLAMTYLEQTPKPKKDILLKQADLAKDIMQKVGSLVMSVTENYLKRCMFVRNYSYNNVPYTLNYLYDFVFGDIFSIKDFFAKEDNKIIDMTKMLRYEGDKQINVMTLHGSKGLEFNHVFIYGLDSSQLGDSAVNLNYWFAPNLSYDEFYSEFKKLFSNFENSYKESDIKKMMTVIKSFYGVYSTSTYVSEIKMRLENKYQLSSKDLHWKNKLVSTARDNGKDDADDEGDMFTCAVLIVKWVTDPSNPKMKLPELSKNQKQIMVDNYVKDRSKLLGSDDYLSEEEIDSLKDEAKKNLVFDSDVKYNFFETVKQVSKSVEEERRLLYVGVTRAKDTLFLQLPKSPNPLLYELTLSKMKPLKDDYAGYQILSKEQMSKLKQTKEQRHLTNELLKNFMKSK